MPRRNRHFELFARVAAWIGIAAIVFLSVVPAAERPVTGIWPPFEHFSAFALVAGAFAAGYDLPLGRLMYLGFFFCAGIEMAQVPLPTRHARVSDFAVDLAATWFAFALVRLVQTILARVR